MMSIHGLVRGENIELGRDADTGGQVKYVIELARALSERDDVWRVDLLTRQVFGKNIDDTYAEPSERIAEGAYIVRIPCGPRRYLHKERLWPHLDSFLDNTLRHIRRVGRVPDVVHGHYADAGYTGAQLARLLGVPFVFTGHSLGRVKRARLLAKGADADKIDARYRFRDRIEAEENALETASLVVASTRQEVREQYELYDHYRAERMEVIPPGVDLSAFHPSEPGDTAPIPDDIRRFLADPDKPVIFAIARPDERKNLSALVEAYGSRPALQQKANLLLVMGNRDDIREMERGSKRVLQEVLYLIDRYDLYGRVAYPKHHRDVPGLYRMAAATRGVFVNPALTEPFGLTLIEAAASGLPIVATNDGGPNDIVAACENGILIDPLDTEAIADALEEVLTDSERWTAWSENGIRGAHDHFSWPSHVKRYLDQLDRLLARRQGAPQVEMAPTRQLTTVDHMIIADLDTALVAEEAEIGALADRIAAGGSRIGFGVATGRQRDDALEQVQALGIPQPDVLFSCVGTQIDYVRRGVTDRSWAHHIDHWWRPDAVREALADLEGLELQGAEEQSRFKISYRVDEEVGPSLRQIKRHLRQRGLRVTCLLSHEAYLDVLPIRASLGLAVRFFALKWGLPAECLLVAGGAGNEKDLLSGNPKAVVVKNHVPELDRLEDHPGIYFAENEGLNGLLEGIEHYEFLDISSHHHDEAVDDPRVGDVSRSAAKRRLSALQAVS
jgi:sucrose-phosphate synthase